MATFGMEPDSGDDFPSDGDTTDGMTFEQFTLQQCEIIVQHGALTVSMPGQPPYLIMPSDSPAGQSVVLFEDRTETERFLKQYPDLFRESPDGFDVYVWEAKDLPHILNCAVQHSGADVTVQRDYGMPELVDPSVAYLMLVEHGISFVALDGGRLFPDPTMTFNVVRTAAGLSYRTNDV